ncbi:MAG TPA: ATP-binding cassette domain-containing protein, partial [Anaerolineales bacterium]|nr:ATP-binding cassette domain-containing protein [Anaerolineales bacterium]
EVIGLSDRAKEYIKKYSGGMKRRVNIGIALLHKPQVIYMDEPTVGIDPQSRRSILDGVVAMKGRGTTVLYTTHYMEEAQELSDHIAILDHGQLIALGTHAELVRIVGGLDRITLTLSAESPLLLEAWRQMRGVQRISSDDGSVGLLVEDSNQVLPRLFDAAADHRVRITSVDILEPNLEAVFLHLTGRALRD